MNGLRVELLYGVLWGVVVWLVASTAFAFTREDLSETGPLLALLVVFWCTRGIAVAIAASWLAARVRPAWAWALFPVIAMATSLAWDGTPMMVSATRRATGVELPDESMFIFTLWCMLIYGAPLFAFCLWEVRARRARSLLAQAEAARVEGTTENDAARLELLRRRVDPQQLLNSLETVRAAVASGDSRAGSHLEKLVDFLRSAMPAVRSSSPVPATPSKNLGDSNEQRRSG